MPFSACVCVCVNTHGGRMLEHGAGQSESSRSEARLLECVLHNTRRNTRDLDGETAGPVPSDAMGIELRFALRRRFACR